MKYILIFISILLISLNSCSDALDMAPEGYTTYDEIFQDNDKTGAYLNSCYPYIPAMGCKYWFWSRGQAVWCDDAWDADAEAESGLISGRYYGGDASASNHPIVNTSNSDGNGDYWNRYWQAIRKCALFLERIDGATVTNETDRQRWKAEAHLLRAFYYSELIRWYGTGLPIERVPFSGSDFSPVEKPSYYESVQFIIEDCDAALSIPELPWRISSDAEAGRVHKAMAEAIKARMILYAASPLYSDGADLWEEAYTTIKTSLANLRAHGYELYNKINYPTVYQSANAHFSNKYSALYNEYFTQAMKYSADPVDKETIYQHRNQGGQYWNVDGIGAQGGYKTGTCPSQELVDAYETNDGVPVLDLSKPYNDVETHLQPNLNATNTLYKESDPYANRDPRFYASIYYNGSKRYATWAFDENNTESPENAGGRAGDRTRVIATWVGEPRTGKHATDRTRTRTGYYERKFLHPTSGKNNDIADASYKMFRLGEVILNFAEAAAEAGHPDEAIIAVNEIRTRAGMPDLPTGLTPEQLILRIRNERRVELAMEGARYFDIRRWSSPNADLARTDKWITAASITRQSDGTYTWVRVPVRNAERQCYSNKYLKLPLPLNEVNIMMEVRGEDWQNPGW